MYLIQNRFPQEHLQLLQQEGLWQARNLLLLLQAEVEAGKLALEQAEMAAVVAATECMNMQKVPLHLPSYHISMVILGLTNACMNMLKVPLDLTSCHINMVNLL